MNMQTILETNSVHKTKTQLEILEDKRTKCLVYTRVMGYHRPVESFNIGKKGEHKQRQHFEEK
jgi:hypothetical protein